MLQSVVLLVDTYSSSITSCSILEYISCADSPQNLLKITNDVFMLKQYNDEPKVTVELYKNRAVFNDKAI